MNVESLFFFALSRWRLVHQYSDILTAAGLGGLETASRFGPADGSVMRSRIFVSHFSSLFDSAQKKVCGTIKEPQGEIDCSGGVRWEVERMF